MLSPAQPTPQPWSSGWTKQSCEAGVWPTCPVAKAYSVPATSFQILLCELPSQRKWGAQL